MEEDIDVLIDEFEKELKKHNDTSTRKKKKPIREASVDVDDLLTLDLDESWQIKPNSSSSKKSIIKCYPTFIASPNFPLGVTKPGVTRICSSLFCSNCDFKVAHFPDHEWANDPDYIFLRTNMPNFEKVREKLKARKGSCAYACHCVAYSTRTLLALHAVPSLPWFCRGH